MYFCINKNLNRIEEKSFLLNYFSILKLKIIDYKETFSHLK